jgi:hypothetical protein
MSNKRLHENETVILNRAINKSSTVAENRTIHTPYHDLLPHGGIFIYLRFYVPLKGYFTYIETSPLPVKGCKNLSLCSALRAFEQGGIFIVPHLL